MKKTKAPPAISAQLKLGKLVGRRQAFSLIAARCSAADAASLQEIRNEHAYRSLGLTWRDFCAQHLGISHTHANRIIGYLEEFGPSYFELVQFTGISADAYRAIASSVTDRAVHYDGQAIALLPENAEKLAIAVEKLRESAAPAPVPPSLDQRIHRLERRLSEFVAEVGGLSSSDLAGEARTRLASAVSAARVKLDRIALQLGPPV